MNKYRCAPIATESTKATFFDYVNAIKIAPIDCFAIGVEDHTQKKFTSLTSRLDWQIFFYKKQFAENDPLIKANILSSRRSIVPLSEVDCVDSAGKEVMRQRALYGIKNGLMFIHSKDQLKYMVLLATGFSKFDHFTFLKKYYSKLIRLTRDFTKIIEHDIDRYFLR